MTRLTLPKLPCPIAPFVPHAQGMCLLDRIVEVGEEHLVADVMPEAQDLFCIDGSIPAWVGLEWMAQAVAAWAGWQAATRGESPAVGFLVGTRRFEAAVDAFPLVQPYRVSVSLDFRADNGLGQFRGVIENDTTPLAEGSLTIYVPTPSHPDNLSTSRASS
ncbi:ApeP family dehydratase [Modicisalibacter luteus]|uniref:Hotdog family protein n=1 Tax=Modicisalibacter luteus TaxID=453962 RepID=A0ABV7M0C0_9GAMM|nr:hotdog family protein [Halomonas lutea]GHA96713.1 3-hydroxylacyl-ACP dehydratase [Halomonas lutea]